MASAPVSTTTSNMLQVLWRTALIWGVSTLILGAVMLLWPAATILVAAVLFGVYLLVSGIAQVLAAFGVAASASSRVLLFISGALSIVLAVLAFRHFGEGYAVLLLAIWIAVGFVFQGVAEIALAANHPELPGRGWQIFVGVLTVIAGVVVLAMPFDSIVALALVTGVWLVVIGISQLVFAFRLRSGAKDVRRVLGA